MGRLGAAVGSGIVTAIAAAILFWIVNRSMQINNVGWLRRQGGLVGDPWVWAAVGFAIGFVGAMVRAARLAAYARAVRDVVPGQGAEYAESFELPPGAETMPAFAGWSNGRHAMTGSADGVPVHVFDCTTIQKGNESDTVTERTVALLTAEGLPDFDLRSRTVGRRLLGLAGFEGLTFDPEAGGPADADAVRRFTERFQLFVGDPLLLFKALPDGVPSDQADREAAVRRLFTPAVMAAVNEFPKYNVESSGGYLAVWRGSGVQPARRRPELWEAAVALRATFLNSSPMPGEPVVPARAGTDVGRQGRRMWNTMLGAGAGFFVGFIVSAIIISILFFGEMRDGEPGTGFFLLPLVFFGCELAAGAIGALIGSQVPVRELPSEDPAREKARHRATRIGVVAGMFAGFFGGFIVFAATRFAFDWKFDNFGIEAAIFFGSIFGTAALGGILGGMAGNRLRR
jgi:hypothetical protein